MAWEVTSYTSVPPSYQYTLLLDLMQSKMVASGDRILAIDGQILDGADYLM